MTDLMRVLEAAGRLVEQLAQESICPTCGADLGEGLPHEPGCALAELQAALDG